MNITKCSKHETSAETERDLILASKFSSWSVTGTGPEEPCPLLVAHSDSLWKGQFSHASRAEQRQPLCGKRNPQEKFKFYTEIIMS